MESICLPVIKSSFKSCAFNRLNSLLLDFPASGGAELPESDVLLPSGSGIWTEIWQSLAA